MIASIGPRSVVYGQGSMELEDGKLKYDKVSNSNKYTISLLPRPTVFPLSMLNGSQVIAVCT